MAPIIRTEKLRKVYAVGKERVVALNNVDLSIEKGEFCCIVGQSGSGKSTLLNQLAGLEKPTSGKVYIGKHEISKMTENELAEFRQQHLGFIFQSYNLLPTMTAAENVALPLMFKGVDLSLIHIWTDGGVRADEGTLVALDALLGVPLGNHNSRAALLVSGSTLLPLAVDVALEGGDRQAVAVHTGDGLHNVADLLDQSLGSLQGLRSRISSGVGPGGGDLDLSLIHI